MAFPVVADFATDSGSGTSHVITIPPRDADDIIVLYYTASEASADTPSDLGGVAWTLLASGGYSDAARVWWLRAANSTGTTVTVTPSASDDFVSVAVRITGAHTTTAPESASATRNSDPPALDPGGWGTDDTLWLTSYSNPGDQVTGVPANYTLIADNEQLNELAAVAERSNAAASEDPGEWPGTTFGDGLSTTIAIRPVGGDTAPTADAGPDQTVDEGDLGALDGTGSSGDALDYAWTVTDDGGTGLADGDLTDRLTATPSFTAPDVSAQSSIIIQLQVTDSGGLTDTDTVTVAVLPGTFNGDYSTGDFSQWEIVQNTYHNDPPPPPDNYAIQITTTDVPVGATYAATFELRDGDTAAGSNERTEVQGAYPESSGPVDSERWYIWRTKFDPVFPDDHASQGWGLVMQWHDLSNGSPPIGFYVDDADGEWCLRVQEQSSPGVFVDSHVLWSHPLDKGVWQEIKLHVYWSTDSDVGFVELWHDGVRQAFSGGPYVGAETTFIQTFTPGGGAGTYAKQGLYRDVNVTGTAIIHHQGYQASVTEEGLGGVGGGTGGPVTRYNLNINPAAKNNLTDWYETGPVAATNRVTGLVGMDRTTGAQVTGTGTGDQYLIPGLGAVTPGQSYTVSAQYRRDGSSGTVSCYLLWVDAALAVLSDVLVDDTATDGVPQRTYASGVAPANAVWAAIQTTLTSTTAQMTTTACLIEEGTAQGTYFDGDSVNASWDGTDGNSSSTVVQPSAMQMATTLTATSGGSADLQFVLTQQLAATLLATSGGLVELTQVVALQGDLAATSNGTAQVVEVHQLGITLTATSGGRADFEVYIPSFISAQGPQRGVPPRPPMRFIAQAIESGEFLSWNLPLSKAKVRYALSGPCTITAEVTPELKEIRDMNLDQDVWIHAEEDGEIRASGILLAEEIDGATGTRDFVAEGFTGYPHGIPYLGQFEGVQIDPVTAVREIWDHLQSYPDAQFGVTVVGSTPIRIGDPSEQVDFETGAGEDVSFEAGPYKLKYWDEPDCGSEINDLATEAPFDFTEHTYWINSHTDTRREMVIHYPRAGRRRKDLRFVQGENITTPLQIKPMEEHANFIVGAGKGEGAAKIHEYVSQRIPGRIRRVYVLDDEKVETRTRMQALIREELSYRLQRRQFDQIVINASHRNAKLGSFQEGDDILVEAEIPYLGMLRIWHRILEYEFDRDANTCTLTLRRSDMFTYGYPE